MENLFFSKTGCKCILKLQEKEELQNPRCIRCQVVSDKKARHDLEVKKEQGGA